MLPDVEAAVETVRRLNFDPFVEPGTVMIVMEFTILTPQVRAHEDAEEKQSQYEGGLGGFWDDYCLAHFLHAVCLRYIVHQVIGICCYPAPGFG